LHITIENNSFTLDVTIEANKDTKE